MEGLLGCQLLARWIYLFYDCGITTLWFGELPRIVIGLTRGCQWRVYIGEHVGCCACFGGLVWSQFDGTDTLLIKYLAWRVVDTSLQAYDTALVFPRVRCIRGL